MIGKSCIGALHSDVSTAPRRSTNGLRTARTEQKSPGCKNCNNLFEYSVMRACLNCQKRKSRCVQNGTARCRYCTRTGKICSFDTPPSRTPLTRNNLDDAERQCARLKDLIRSINPAVNIDLELQNQNPTPPPDATTDHGALDDAGSSPQGPEWREGPLSPESSRLHDPQSADTDGMANLTTNSSGYLGMTTSASINYTSQPLTSWM